MMKYFSFLFTFLFCTGAFAQIDQSKDDLSGKTLETRPLNLSGGGFQLDRSPMQSDRSKILLGQPDALSLDRNQGKAKVDIRDTGDYVQKTVEFNPEYLKQGKERNGTIKGAYSKAQDLGKYFSDGKFVKISWRDAQVVDGDQVDILLNGKVLVHGVTLLAGYSSMYIDLKKGFNKIAFKALNQGYSGPNTAEFMVEDDHGTVLVHGRWNLLTGAEASLLVVKNH